MEEEAEVTTTTSSTTSSSTRVQQQSFFTTTTSTSSFSSSGIKQLAQSTFAATTGDASSATTTTEEARLGADGPPRAALLGSMKGSRSPLFGHSLLTRTLQQTQQQQQTLVQRSVMQHQMSEDASDAETVIADESSGEETRYRLPSQSSPAEAVVMTTLRQQSSASSTQHSVASSLTPRSSEDTESDRLAFSLEEEDELSEEVLHVEQHHHASSGSHRAVSPAGREGRQWLTADSAVGGAPGANSRSMESLRTASSTSRRAYQAASERDLRDLRRVVATSVEARSLESLERQIRRAVSGEALPAGGVSAGAGAEDAALSAAERRRGLFAAVGERRTTVPQHLSLPPPSFLSPGDRRLTILSPHSPEVLHLSSSSSSSVFMSSLKTRRKPAVVLPRLVLPRSESVFSV
ncbi:Vasodilator-stimulated phosphoprotein [Frankliniella fusca]|uniref:Vasodilator-stimulated phosphoprotein n=1 Tax=Frankliniella fusca TaxID=407009 RepID=A0AAE1HEI0_9NEOP|nr:Vasodilator-stimulated phosphoprotein [Frankliniella fusca]